MAAGTGRCIAATELTIDAISVSPPEPVDPKWVLLDVSNNPVNKAKLARPYPERTKFNVGDKIKNVTTATPLQFVYGYVVIADTYKVVSTSE
ncbi:MAG TPA: hypothetical protein PLN21_21405 [Gemmatales bacterium]|nr:hypothetical protein [Gemmatales bacterium]